VAFRRHAAAIGLSAVGVARYDPRYHFVDYHGQEKGDRVVVGFVEQSWEAVQRAPSPLSERSTFEAQTKAHALMTDLAVWLHARGYAAAAEPGDAHGIIIHYAVEAGLGQLGLNGQLLTPQAGSRCRPAMLTTDAPLEFDAPRDYGVTRICDACQVCVQRCPTGAIPARRWMNRGVEKAKINVSRCLPVMGHAFGCAICMKVCPVQRYGLETVTREFERTGAIVGKGTDELESYVWPVDGKRYCAGAKPPIPRGLTHPSDLTFEPPRYAKPPSAEVSAPVPTPGHDR
jgi:ferredoxin